MSDETKVYQPFATDPQAILQYYASPSAFTALGDAADLERVPPAGIPELCQALRGLIVHYVASSIPFAPARKAEIDTRWVEIGLKTIQVRNPSPLSKARAPEGRFVGCCRDFATVFVAILRAPGIPARTRIGFATYFNPDFQHNHGVAE